MNKQDASVKTLSDTLAAPDPSRRQRRGHGRPTLDDVAQAASVTRITVSRFIRRPQLVAGETAERIRTAIAQTGYVPNRQAGQLASGSSHLIAALIPNVGNSIFAETIQALTEGLQGSGYELLLLSTGYSLEREEQQLRALAGWAPAALIVTGRRHTHVAAALLRDARTAGTPVVEIWDQSGEANDTLAQIGFDHHALGRTMAQHLLSQGHRVLAYVDSGVTEDYRAHERGAGFAAAAHSSGSDVHVLPAPTGDAFDAGRKMLDALLQHQPVITAAAFANDHLACGVLMQAQAIGVDVPRRLALLGFGDFPIGRQLRPGLSTVRPPTAEIGHAAASAVLAALRSGIAPQRLMLDCTLITRGSSVN